MNYAERYKKRKNMLNQIENTITIESDVNQDMVNEFLHSKVNVNLINKTTQIMETHYKFEYDLHVSPEEAKEFLNK
jgi:hypothetical protein